jgi:hypothetical protein
MERRDRNQVEMEVMKIATMGSMIRNPLSSGEQIREIPSLNHDHDWSRCQAFQPIWVFGIHNRASLSMLPAGHEAITAQDSAPAVAYIVWTT